MKTILFCFLFTISAFSQEAKAEYPGGKDSFLKFLMTNFRVPESTTGKVRFMLDFFVETDGKVRSVQVIGAEDDKALTEEATRVVLLSNWEFAKEGTPVRTRHTFPVTIHTE